MHQRRWEAEPERRPPTSIVGRSIELMLRRGTLLVATLYVAAGLIGHARERSGAISCGCHPDCWCKRPGLSLFRWVFPFWHKPR